MTFVMDTEILAYKESLTLALISSYFVPLPDTGALDIMTFRGPANAATTT
jgi:hypothetical protein